MSPKRSIDEEEGAWDRLWFPKTPFVSVGTIGRNGVGFERCKVVERKTAEIFGKSRFSAVQTYVVPFSANRLASVDCAQAARRVWR
jgi:hypothetical protein